MAETCFTTRHVGSRLYQVMLTSPLPREEAMARCRAANRAARMDNAPLIDAAPDMLAALRRAKIVLEGVIHPTCRRPDDALAEIDAAIARAEGRAALSAAETR